MKWTNLQYKAEDVKIHDNEHLLREALQGRALCWRKKRSEHSVEKTQQRQDKRRQNLRKKAMKGLEGWLSR